MTIYEKICKYEDDRDMVLSESDKWIEEIKNNGESIENYKALAHVYYLREIYIFNCVDAEKACAYFAMIPIRYYGYDLLEEYIVALKFCYHFKDFIELSKQILKCEERIAVRYLVLRELVDSSIVADGVMTKEEYRKYKKQLVEL